MTCRRVISGVVFAAAGLDVNGGWRDRVDAAEPAPGFVVLVA
jgi:hypothetical protein